MEEEEYHRFYRLLLTDGKIVSVHRDIFEQFGTLSNAATLSGLERDTPIQLDERVTKPLLQWAIDAYMIMAIRQGQDFPPLSVDHLYTLRDVLNRMRRLQKTDNAPLLASLFDGDEPTLKDIETLAALVDALSWLEAEDLWIITLEKIYALVRALTLSDINKLVQQNKRKQVSFELGLPLTPYYERELLIREYLNQLLPYELLTAIVGVARYINPIATGNSHQLFLKAGGVLYGSGWTAGGELGIETTQYVIRKPTRITNLPGKALLIACGGSHSLCYTTAGLYGSGVHPKLLNSKTWVKLSLDGELLMMVSAMYATFVVTTSGLYAAGFNDSLQLGIGEEREHEGFMPVEVSGKVIDIALGYTHTIVLTTQGLYGCGTNTTGQLPYEPEGAILAKLKPLTTTGMGKIVAIACGGAHTMVITAYGRLYASGRNGMGQLGLGDLVDRYKWTEVTRLEGTPVSVHSGGPYTVLRTTQGLYATGHNNYGQLAVGDTLNRQVFTKMLGLEDVGEIISITCAITRVFVLTTNGVYLSGGTSYLDVNAAAEQQQQTAGSPSFIVFVKIDDDLGYSMKGLRYDGGEVEDDEDEPATKVRRLKCHHCQGTASFLSTESLPICSKYCLVKSRQ